MKNEKLRVILSFHPMFIGGNPFNGMIEENQPGVPKGFLKHRFNNWGPRIGIAWDPKGDGKMSIRAGGGVFFIGEAPFGSAQNEDGLGC